MKPIGASPRIRDEAPCVHAVLFDLDGTLLDTAPDLVAVLDRLLDEHGVDPDPRARICADARSRVSHGVDVMLRHGFPDAAAPQLAALRSTFLERYLAAIAVQTRPFPGIDALLERLESDGIVWGIVTNKPARYTDALLAELNIDRRAGVVVSGDTLPQAKPHPAPMLHAAARLGVAPEAIVCLGDAPRDIEAGRAAGMWTAAVAWGYHAEDDPPTRWGADWLLSHPDDLTRRVRLCAPASRAIRGDRAARPTAPTPQTRDRDPQKSCADAP